MMSIAMFPRVTICSLMGCFNAEYGMMSIAIEGVAFRDDDGVLFQCRIRHDVNCNDNVMQGGYADREVSMPNTA